MSLATRCPACSTVFRVVQDQLRVSEGWVRCGQCQEVFNALETLFDLDTEPAALPPGPQPPAPQPPSPPPPPPQPAVAHSEAPAPEPPPPPPPVPAPAPASAPAKALEEELAALDASPHPADEWAPDPTTLPMSLEALAASYRAARADDAPAELRALAPAPSAPAPAPDDTPTIASPLAAAEEDDDDAQAPTPSRFIGPAPDWARTPAPRERRKKTARRAAGSGDAHAQPHQSKDGARRRRKKPEFVRQAERAAQWRRPLVRLVLGLAATTLAAMLAGQVAYHLRDQLAARAPVLAPALHAGCAWLGCRVGAPRALERIRLDASDLTRTGQEQVLRFVADLHNTADHAVRAPALDLSFTNAAGEVVSRKVLLPGELNAPRGEAIAADGQWHVDALLAVGYLRVAGYTVEVFYP